MLKKITILLLMIIMFACQQKTNNNNEHIDIETQLKPKVKDVDMSSYRNMSSTKHCFKEIDLNDFYAFIKEKGSGLFYMGYEGCESCQEAIEHLNAVAQMNNLTIYYLNIDKPEYRIKDSEEAYNKLVEETKPILPVRDGKKVILTPNVFQLINGDFGKSHVGLTTNWQYKQKNEDQINELKNIYYNLMKPFIQK